MAPFILRRLASVIVILFVVAVVVFSITNILPGNVAYMILGDYATPHAVAALEHKLGLNDPLPIQFWRWFSGFMRGDMGRSLLSEQPVQSLIALRLPRSLVLAVIVTISTALLGTAFGVLTATHQGGPIDHGLSLLTFIGIALPEFFWGIVLIVVFAGQLRLLPSSGYTSFAQGPLAWAQHLVLPALTLNITMLAHVTRLTRANMIDVLKRQFITTARSKGLREYRVNWGHALKNALLPTTTVIAMNIGWLMGGIVVVETVFAYPGLGRLMLQAIVQRDLPVIQSTILLSTFIYCISNLAADIAYSYLDPRIRYR